MEDLWGLLGDLKLSLQSFAKHFAARAALLIALPLIVYCLTFVVHFQ